MKQSSKVFARYLTIGHSRLSKLKTDDGKIITSTPELLREVENFYGQLYTSTTNPAINLAEDPRARLTEEIPDVSLQEIQLALKQLKNNKAPGDDGGRRVVNRS